MHAAVYVGAELGVIADHRVDHGLRLGRGRGAVEPGDGRAVELARQQRKVGFVHAFTRRYFPEPSGAIADSFCATTLRPNSSDTARAARSPSPPTTRSRCFSSCQSVIAGS